MTIKRTQDLGDNLSEGFEELREAFGGGLLATLGAILALTLLIVFVVALIAPVVAAIWAVVGLVILVAWNVGVVGLAGAAGGSVSTIGFWTAFGCAAAVSVLKGIISAGRSKAA